MQGGVAGCDVNYLQGLRSGGVPLRQAVRTPTALPESWAVETQVLAVSDGSRSAAFRARGVDTSAQGKSEESEAPDASDIPAVSLAPSSKEPSL